MHKLFYSRLLLYLLALSIPAFYPATQPFHGYRQWLEPGGKACSVLLGQ